MRKRIPKRRRFRKRRSKRESGNTEDGQGCKNESGSGTSEIPELPDQSKPRYLDTNKACIDMRNCPDSVVESLIKDGLLDIYVDPEGQFSYALSRKGIEAANKARDFNGKDEPSEG